ncbi:MAG: hypothetical protein KJO42_00340 [Silicimonas sp.]|nr:hypothetical protein [Silicimonas sp.]NNF92267.1 hypothetical protein [Boseongicola sp.]RZW12680.1 MAG: hypothetical protein EX266_00595 [Paracoccaceae bacterium]MBT8426294.1 hypothetical protein [Silicimonas sp.]NND22239.1 hypothetical protein [Silicimonas sp.]
MGYDLYITRKDDWSDTSGPDISMDDWTEYLFIDKSLEIDARRAAEIDPRVASHAKEPTHTRWLDWPARVPDENEAWMWIEQGNIVATDPDIDFRRKLFLIADGLEARLMGTDGEVYDSIGEPESGRSRLTEKGAKRAWWKFW